MMFGSRNGKASITGLLTSNQILLYNMHMKKYMKSNELKRLRRSLGWNQARLGEEVGVSSNTVARWERGASPVPKAVARLVRLLAVNATPSAVGNSSLITRDSHHAAILKALSEHFDPDIFEACAADLLGRQWPGLVPVRGGSDDGFDGAISSEGKQPFPLVSTTSTDAKGNLKRNLKRAIESGWQPAYAIFATPRRVTPKTRKAMRDLAREMEVTLVQIYDQDWFANALYREPAWCKKLLGVTGRPSALSVVPESNRPIIGDRVIGREACLERLRSSGQDCLLVGHPGSGKTFVLRSLALEGAALFLTDDDPESIANAIREQAPMAIIVDDAHVDLPRLQLLQRLRAELDAPFRIIATGWRSHINELKSALSLVNEDVVELDLLDADTMVEVIKAAGIEGPTPLVREIRKQAGGRPGLAVTLVYLCLRGDVREVFFGESLVEQLSPILKRIVGEDTSRLLAAFSLAGDAGCTIEIVASCLRRSVDEVSTLLAKLSAAGVIREGNHRMISVWPSALRWVLVRQVFFEGPGSLDYRDLYADMPNKTAALHSLIGARSRGAHIPDLEALLEQHQSTHLWSEYSGLGSREARYVLTQHPELAVDIASTALELVSDEVIPHLMDRAIGDHRKLHNSLDHPLRLIEDWISQPEEYVGPRADRRYALLDAVKAWWQHKKDQSDHREIAQTCLRALSIVFTPTWNYGESDPGRGRIFTISTGIAVGPEKDAIGQLWSVEKEIIRESAVISGAWTELLHLIHEWVSPIGIREDTQAMETRREFARQITHDVSAWSTEFPGVQHRIQDIAKILEFTVPLKIDPEFEVLFPRENIKELDDLEDFRELDIEWQKADSNLASIWANSDPGIVAEKVAYFQNQADTAHITYPRQIPDVANKIAERSTIGTVGRSRSLTIGHQPMPWSHS